MHINPDIVLAGKSSLDGETSQVPPETAEMAGYNFVSNVSSIEIMENSVLVSRDEDDGLRKLEVSLPAFFSVSEKINRARQKFLKCDKFIISCTVHGKCIDNLSW